MLMAVHLSHTGVGQHPQVSTSFGTGDATKEVAGAPERCASGRRTTLGSVTLF